MKLRAAYDDHMPESDRSGINCQERVDEVTGEIVATPSLAKQSFADEVDINTIVRRFGLTGQLSQGVRMPTYADFEDVPTFHEAMNAIRDAEESFMAMPADVRARFHNDAGEFVDFCSDEKNREEAIRLGLVVPQEEPKAPEPMKVEIVAGGAPAAPLVDPAKK